MIHPDDIIGNPDFPGAWLVTRLGGRDLQCVLREDGNSYMYPEVDVNTLDFTEGSGWSVLDCPHAVQPVMTTDVLTERHLAMASNTGRMEATIEILFDRIRRMGETAKMYGHLGVLADCEAMQDTITRCAQALRDMPLVEGGNKTTELKAYIAAQQ